MAQDDCLGLLRAAALQLSSRNDVDANLAASERLMERAAARGARLLLLPENFAYQGSEAGKRSIAEMLPPVEPGGPIFHRLSALAQRLDVTVVAGGFPEQSEDPERPFNTCIVIGPDGVLLSKYRKLHLFDVTLPDGTTIQESAATQSGQNLVVADVLGVRIGLSICYDLRFPELYRALSRERVDIIVVPSAFTLLTGKDHWHVLLRARAIENQSWLIAANQWGSYAPGKACYGHSLIVDPWGTIVAECSDGEGMAVADIDMDLLRRVREHLPALTHRRLDLP